MTTVKPSPTFKGEDGLKRCFWCASDPIYVDYHDNEWGRKGQRSDGAAFTIDTFGRYMVHDPIHHLWDVAH